ncbi:MAG: hypothetical protein V3T86_10255 [Planctomycetota bacterium]
MRGLAVLTVLIAVAGCRSPIDIHVSRHPARSLEGRRTYSWSGQGHSNAVAVAAVDEALRGHGFVRSETDADFRVACVIVVSEETVGGPRPRMFPHNDDDLGEYGFVLWDERYERLETGGDRPFDKVSVMLECLEPHEKKLI